MGVENSYNGELFTQGIREELAIQAVRRNSIRSCGDTNLFKGLDMIHQMFYNQTMELAPLHQSNDMWFDLVVSPFWWWWTDRSTVLEELMIFVKVCYCLMRHMTLIEVHRCKYTNINARIMWTMSHDSRSKDEDGVSFCVKEELSVFINCSNLW